MDRRFAICILALSLVASAAAQEPAAARQPAGVAVPVPAGTKDAPPGNADPAAARKPSEAALQFDAKGVDFGPWIRRFKSTVMRNWLVPLAAMNQQGRVVVTFVVHRDGAITDVVVATPSDVDSFNLSARKAIEGSTPVAALPAGYPDDSVTFTVTFFFNDTPSSRAPANPPIQ
jgi:TonB family protein